MTQFEPQEPPDPDASREGAPDVPPEAPPAGEPGTGSAPVAAPGPPENVEDSGPASSDEFRRALEEFERGSRSAASRTADVTVGTGVHGTLVTIGEEHSLVDFGGRSEGVIETRHLRDESGALRYGAGDTLDLWVVKADDQVILAPSLRADPRAALQQLRESLRAGIPVTGRVVDRNVGGLEVDLSGVRAFCPVSQIEAGYCADPSVYVGRTLDFLISSIDSARGNAVLSRKTLLVREQAQKAEQFIASLKAGDELEGTVARLEDFGAFVDLGGVDGLVHVSEIRHEHTVHPREALSKGQRVRVRVLRIDAGKDGRPRIALSIKAGAPDPWTGIETRFTAGERVRGRVVRLTDFGAFVNLAPGVDGLVHVSEAAPHPVKHVKEALAPGQEVEAIVRGVDPVKKRISLSIREALGVPGDEPRRVPAVGDAVEGFVAGIKPYGLFIDLPVYGHRVRGLAPQQETGEPRGADLGKRFKVGDRVAVEVIELREGKIRVSLERAHRREEGKNAEAYDVQPPGKPEEPTLMAIALRRAMERAKAKESGETR